MAKRFWNINQGQHQTDVVEGAASGATAVEINYDLTAGLSREEVLFLIDFIKNVIIQDPWPPA